MTLLVGALRAAVEQATDRLAEAGVGSPRFDAEELAALSLGVDRAGLWRYDAPGERFAELVAARAARVPLQHLTGRAGFRHLDLHVGPGVFVPRPETELVAGAVVEEARALGGAGSPPLVVDLCAGSGAIALAVADEVPSAQVHAVEIDPSAHAWARRNLDRHPAGDRVRLVLDDAARALPELAGVVDVVVSNPPYVPAGARPLDPEVADHDPGVSLYGGGEDGLDVLRSVLGSAWRLLRPGGLLVVEHGEAQGAAVRTLLDRAGWRDATGHADLAGRPRYATARRPGAAGAAP